MDFIDPLGTLWPGINPDSEGKHLFTEEPEEGQDSVDPEHNQEPTYDMQEDFEFSVPQKYLNFDVEFLTVDDMGTKYPEQPNIEAPLDDFDGIVPKDQASHEEYRPEPKKVQFRKDFDYPEFYDQLIWANRTARIKTAGFQLGDFVQVVRPWRYGLEGSPRRSVGEILGTQDNGWLIIRSLSGEKVAVYSGLSHEDADVVKIDLKKLLIQEEAQRRRYEHEMLKFSSVLPTKVMDRLMSILEATWTNTVQGPNPAIDEDKSTYMIENYGDEDGDA